MPSEEQFFNKLGEIPVLNDGWTAALGYYSKVKDFNSLTKYTIGVAENGVKKAAAMSSPVISRYQSQLDTVNGFACSKLNELESKYPLITQPTGEVKDACVEYVQPVVGRVKPVVTYVQGVVDNGKRRVVRIKTCSTNLVTGARDLGVNTVSHAVTVTLDTPPGRLATRTMDGVLTCAEGLVDKYIPAQEEDEEGDPAVDGNGHDAGECDGGAVEEMEVMEPSPQRVVIHFKSVSKKLRERMFRRAMRDFQRAKTRTTDALSKLSNTVDLVRLLKIDYAKKNLNGARDKVEDLWGHIMDTSDPPTDGEDRSFRTGTLEDRIVLIGRTLANQVRSGVTALEKASGEAGQFVRHPITKSKEYTDFVYHFSADLMNTSVDKAKESLSFFQKRLQIMIDNMESPEWLAVDIEMEDIGLEEGDLNNDQPLEEETDVPRPENHI